MLNRELALRSIAQAISQTRAQGDACGVLVVRVLRLRETEQMLGYEAMDRLADAARGQIAAALRPADTLVQIGECDFLVILPNLRNQQQTQLAAAKIARVLNMPLAAGNTPIRALYAIGGAVCMCEDEHAEQLCLRADAACNRAMQTHRRIVISEQADDSAMIDYDDLFVALRDNALQVYLQPIFNVCDGVMLGVESLARWQHPEHGWVPPDQFVALAEKTRLIGELTRWSINSTLRHCAPALAAQPHITCAINLSAELVSDSSMAEQLATALEVWNVNPASVVVEVTETAFVSSAEQVSAVLRQIKRMGVAIAIDDFGSGFASWGYLQHFPVDYLKIDRSFVRAMGNGQRGRQLVSAMIDLAHRLGAKAVAEGVSDPAELTMLRELGCDRQQGFLMGRPVPADEALSHLAPARA